MQGEDHTLNLDITQVDDPLVAKSVAGVEDGKLIDDLGDVSEAVTLLPMATDINLSDHFEDPDAGDVVSYSLSATHTPINGQPTQVSQADVDRTFGQLLVGDVLQGGFALSSGLLAGDWVVTVTAVSSGDRGFTLSKSLSFSLPEVPEELDPPEEPAPQPQAPVPNRTRFGG